MRRIGGLSFWFLLVIAVATMLLASEAWLYDPSFMVVKTFASMGIRRMCDAVAAEGQTLLAQDGSGFGGTDGLAPNPPLEAILAHCGERISRDEAADAHWAARGISRWDPDPVALELRRTGPRTAIASAYADADCDGVLEHYWREAVLGDDAWTCPPGFRWHGVLYEARTGRYPFEKRSRLVRFRERFFGPTDDDTCPVGLAERRVPAE